MVGACQQNSGIFLVRGGGLDGVRQRTRSGQRPDGMPARAEAGTGTRYRRGSRPGLGQDAGDQITGQVADWSGQGPDEMPARTEAGTGTRYRRGPRPGLGQDAGDQITGQAAGSERPGTGRDTGGG